MFLLEDLTVELRSICKLSSRSVFPFALRVTHVCNLVSQITNSLSNILKLRP